MQLTKDNILNIDKSKYNELPKEQQDLVIQILKEYGDLGYSKTLEDIWMADYEEIPVDVVTFISDERYLGKSTRQGTSIYPFWMKEYENIFDDDNGYLEVVLTGAIGIGKTRTAVVCLCYLLYLIMCLKIHKSSLSLTRAMKLQLLSAILLLNLLKVLHIKLCTNIY